MMTGASRSAPPKLAQAPLRALTGMARSVFPFSARWSIVARLLRGEPLELVARETNVSIARLSEWRERALAGAGFRNILQLCTVTRMAAERRLSVHQQPCLQHPTWSGKCLRNPLARPVLTPAIPRPDAFSAQICAAQRNQLVPAIGNGTATRHHAETTKAAVAERQRTDHPHF
jgi:hypothetical protein